jgi:hypothetical protein
MSWKRWKEKKRITENAIKICIFISIISLPFVTVTQMIGIDTFLDSFENPEDYICLQDKDNLFATNTKNGEYVIIQKSSHPNFDVKKSDSIVYCKNDGSIACNKVYRINNIGAIKRYHITGENDITSQPIYEYKIIGKIIKVVDGNIWNSISLRVWETSIHSLNLRALLTND